MPATNFHHNVDNDLNDTDSNNLCNNDDPSDFNIADDGVHNCLACHIVRKRLCCFLCLQHQSIRHVRVSYTSHGGSYFDHKS